ncbi:MAG: TIGR01244 family sulfur transferase [Woeseiaceae bacterium]
MAVYKLTETCSVAGQIAPSDVEIFRKSGFKTIVCNRPDDEDTGQPTAADVRAECDSHGVVFHHLPITNTGITAEMVRQFQTIVADSDGPVLAYCRSGQRSSVLWQYSGSP